MQDSVDSKAMHAHGLHHRAPALLGPIWLVLRRVPKDNPCLLVGDDFTHCPILGEASIALVQLLHDSKLLALCDAGRMIVHAVLADDFHVHVLQHDAVESHGELLLGEVGLGEHRDLQDGFLLPNRSSTNGRS